MTVEEELSPLLGCSNFNPWAGFSQDWDGNKRLAPRIWRLETAEWTVFTTGKHSQGYPLP